MVHRGNGMADVEDLLSRRFDVHIRFDSASRKKR